MVYADAATLDAATAVRRGAARLFADLGYAHLHEFELPDGRRADIACLGRKGDFTIVEVKSGVPDFRADSKWPDYLDWCDRFYFAVDARFPLELIPMNVGLIVADAFGGAIVRDAPYEPIAAARRKAQTLRYGRAAAFRLGRFLSSDDTL